MKYKIIVSGPLDDAVIFQSDTETMGTNIEGIWCESEYSASKAYPRRD